MAKKNKKASTRGITREQLWKIWGVVTARHWLEFANKYQREAQFEFVGQGALRGLCPRPEHADTDPSFHINHNGDLGYAHCYGCGYNTSNPIELAALILKVPESEAIQFLQEHFKLGFLSKKALAELEAQRVNQLTKRAIFRAAHEIMCEEVATPGTHPFAKTALDWLTKERSVPAGSLYNLPVGIMPPLVTLAEILHDTYNRTYKAWSENPGGEPEPRQLAEPAFEYLKDSYANSLYNGAVVWPLHVTPNDIGRLKLRVPQGGKKLITIPADDFEDLLGLYGLGWNLYRDILDPKVNTEWVYLTEGEMDVMSYMAQCVSDGPSFPLFSVGGRGGSGHIEPILRSIGVQGAYLVGDEPHKGSGGSDIVVRDWIEHMPVLRSKVFVGWDALQPADDLDNAVVVNGVDAVTDALWKDTEKTFLPSWQWVVEKAEEEMEAVPDNDRRLLIEKAVAHGECLRNRTDAQSFIESISNKYDIKEAHLKREMASSEDSELGFILRCQDALKDELFVVGSRPEYNARWLILNHRESQRFHRVKLDSEQSIAQELAPIFGTLLNFVEDKVGFPRFLSNPHTAEGLVYSNIDHSLRFYMKEAVNNLACGAADFSASPELRQGYHRETLRSKELAEYVVCGTDVFKIRRNASGDSYELLEGPSDNGIIFNIGLPPKAPEESWFPGGLTVEALNSAKDIDIKEVYKTLVDIYTENFKFKNHEVTPKLLAALMLVFPVMAAFPRQMLTFVTGDTHSGKTNLMATFCGIGFPQIQLLKCGHGLETYTAAGVMNMTKGDTRLMGLDEFETTDPRRAIHVETITTMVRGLVTESSKSVKATQDGDYEIATRKLPMMFSAISGADKPQDLNRLLIIEMEKIKGKENPAVKIIKKYTVQGIEDLAKKIAVCMYPRVPEILACRQKIADEYSEFRSELPFVVEDRYASMLFAPMALLRMLGLDWKGLFKEWVTKNENTIHRATTTSESHTFLDRMLVRTISLPGKEMIRTTLSQMLTNPEQWPDINSSATGAFFDSDKNLLMFRIEQAFNELFSSYRHREQHLSSTRLKDTLDRHKLALKPHEILASGILQKAKPFLGANMTTEDVVVFQAEDLIGIAQPTESTKDNEEEDVKEEETEVPKDGASKHNW